MKIKFLSNVLGAISALAVTAGAQEAKLNIGDPAPKLQVAEWVQGEPVKGFDSGKAYIVEFWATWCGPCRVSIPHLNELHKKFKDKGLIVIGQDVFERDETKVKPFVEKMGDSMTYRVATDDKSTIKDGAMAKNWMEAAEQEGIPTAFVVNKSGKIAWIGHPSELKEPMLEAVLADKFDIEKAKKDAAEAKTKAAAEAAEAEKKAGPLRDASRKLGTAIQGKKWDEAEVALTELEQLVPEERRPMLGMARFEILAGKKDYAGAYKLAGKLSDAQPENPGLQNSIAWTIATKKDLENRDLAVAQKAAERASEATEGKNPAVLYTLARVQFMNGKKTEAVATAQKAVELADAENKEVFEKSLASYKADKLPDLPAQAQ